MRNASAGWGHSVAYDDIAGEVAIAGVGEADHSKASGRTARAIAAQAVERALDDAGLRPDEVDGLMTSPGVGDQFDAAAYHDHFGTCHPL